VEGTKAIKANLAAGSSNCRPNRLRKQNTTKLEPEEGSYMELKLFRCRICGDPYLGSEPPSYCPFCGAPQKYMAPAEEYVDRNDVPNLSAQSRANLEKALDLEVRNAAFYMCASDCAQDPVAKAMFKAL
jgi:hypothetical protein